MQNTTPSPTDECIIQTFNMLVDRMSNLEDLIRQQQDAMIFAECCKYGRLNNKILGYPFKITRRPTYSKALAKCQDDPDTSMYKMAIVLTFHEECTCRTETAIPSALEVVAGKEYAADVLSRNYDTHPSDAGWVDSRFPFAHEEAIQRYIDSIFKDSAFEVTLYSIDPSLSISSKKGRDISLPVLLEQIPKIVTPLGHTGVTCIESIEITEINSALEERIKTIQKAANLKEGALKDECVRKRDKYRRHDLQRLKDMDFASSLFEVYDFLKSKGFTFHQQDLNLEF